MLQEPTKIHVEWSEYFELLRKLFTNIRASDFKPEQIVCIARGGLIPGNLASFSFNAPLAVLSVASYPDHATRQEEMRFSRDLTTAHPLRRRGVLIVDDLTETGTTLVETRKWLAHWYDIDPGEMRTATIWHKDWSAYVPDFYAEVVRQGPAGERPWIIQPQESFRREDPEAV